MRDAWALVRYLAHRRSPAACAWSAPAGEGELADFALSREGHLLAIQGGGLGVIDQGGFTPFGPVQGALRLFETEGGILAAGTYHRVLAWDGARGLQHLVSVRGPVRDLKEGPDGPWVAFEGSGLASGLVQRFRRTGNLLEPEGLGIAIGMDRWSGFELSPDGRRLLANMPDGKGVGVWSTEDARLLAVWPVPRLARLLCFLDGDRVLFEEGPVPKGPNAAYANPANRLCLARIGSGEAPVAVASDFATILATAQWPDRSRLAFADLEGQVRVVVLGEWPHLGTTFAPWGRGLPWRLRPAGRSLWLLSKGSEVRIERYGIE